MGGTKSHSKRERGGEDGGTGGSHGILLVLSQDFGAVVGNTRHEDRLFLSFGGFLL
jgi:hypothetical protein